MNFFDSIGPDLGQSLSGGATGGLMGFIQGMQLKQQMEKQALENKRLASPPITPLGEGSYMEYNPATGTHELKQVPGRVIGGLENQLLLQHLRNGGKPEELVKLYGMLHGHTPEGLQAQQTEHTAKANEADATTKLRQIQQEYETGKMRNEALQAGITAQDISARSAEHTAHAGYWNAEKNWIESGGKTRQGAAGDPVKREIAPILRAIFSDPNWANDPVKARTAELLMRSSGEYYTDFFGKTKSKFTGEAPPLAPAEEEGPGMLEQGFDWLKNKLTPTPAPSVPGEHAAQANEQKAVQLQQRLENDPNLTPGVRQSLEAQAKAATEWAAKHRGRSETAPATPTVQSAGQSAVPAPSPALKGAQDFLDTAGYFKALQALKTKKMPNGKPLKGEYLDALQQVVDTYKKSIK